MQTYTEHNLHLPSPGDSHHITIRDTFAQIHSSGSEFSSLNLEKLIGLLVQNLVCLASLSVQSGAHIVPKREYHAPWTVLLLLILLSRIPSFSQLYS